MLRSISKGLKTIFRRTISSIAFLPSSIGIGFLLLSFIAIRFDYSVTGQSLKAGMHWLVLKDANTARSICTAVASGLISLVVFSFSMFMIVLNQAASQMSNRILDKLIGNRFQQVVLGFYIGTIIYALFLLSTIRVDSPMYVPAISTYLLIILTISNIFLFVYFLHYITDAVKYETIIKKIHQQTKEELLRSAATDKIPEFILPQDELFYFHSVKSGIFQNADIKELISICCDHNVVICFLYPTGTFILEKAPLFSISGANHVSQEFLDEAALYINISPGQSIDTNFYNGFQHLMEIALKALSPAMNDPDTAVLALQALFDLLSIRARVEPQTIFCDSNKYVRLVLCGLELSEIFHHFIFPIWDYGKNDRLIQREFLHLSEQLKYYGEFAEIEKLEKMIHSHTAEL